jgi:hypothetical protein
MNPLAKQKEERLMENLLSPVRKTGPQQAEHRPRGKAYVSPRLKVYGKMWELTAAGTGLPSEFLPTNCSQPNPSGAVSCRL